MRKFAIEVSILIMLFLCFTGYIWSNRLYYSKVASVRSDSGVYDIAIAVYYIKFRTMPQTIDDLFYKEYHDVRKLLSKNDPWGNGYLYTYEERSFQIISLGSDGRKGGYGTAEDIICNYKK